MISNQSSLSNLLYHLEDLLPFKVFRCQLSRRNEFFPYESPVETPDWKPGMLRYLELLEKLLIVL